MGEERNNLSVKVGVVQPLNLPTIDSVPKNREENGLMIKKLFEQGTKIVVLPECANHQYMFSYMEDVMQFSETTTGDSIDQWSQLASKYNGYIVGGIIEQDDDCYYNTAVVIGPHGLIGRYRKVHLFNWEKDFLKPGNLGFPTFYLEELDVTIGMLICYDLRFPEAVRTLMLSGCDLLLVPTTWTSIGKKIFWDEQGYCLADYLAVAHAYSNKLPIVCANRVGKENDVQFMGASIIVDANADVIAGPASNHRPAILSASIDVRVARDKRIGDKNDLRGDRRPECYHI